MVCDVDGAVDWCCNYGSSLQVTSGCVLCIVKHVTCIHSCQSGLKLHCTVIMALPYCQLTGLGFVGGAHTELKGILYSYSAIIPVNRVMVCLWGTHSLKSVSYSYCAILPVSRVRVCLWAHREQKAVLYSYHATVPYYTSMKNMCT